MVTPEPFAHADVAARIAVSLGVGLLVGLEREWAHKEVGVRTFAITALLGALTSLLGPELVVTALVGALLLVGFLNVQSLRRDGSLELTTSASLIVTLVLGALAGHGHYFTAVTSAIAVTMLLAWKVELSRFAGGLQPEEIRSAVLLGLISLVVQPLLPDRVVDPWALVNPHEAWVVVVVIAGLGFGNYWLLRLYGARGAYYAAFLGGLVNSTAAAAELTAQFVRSTANMALGVSLVLLTNVAMFLRNATIVAIFAPAVVRVAAPPLVMMGLGCLPWLWPRTNHSEPPLPQLKMSSPLSLRRVLSFGALFVALAAAGTLMQRYFGGAGFLLLSGVGGLVSSASATASAASLAASGTISPETAAVATILTSMASAVIHVPVVYYQGGRGRLFAGLVQNSVLVVVLGLATLALHAVWPW
jgi:uncharacterized membrane protein (DUF4010 family)